jgi:hypothetical protein
VVLDVPCHDGYIVTLKWFHVCVREQSVHDKFQRLRKPLSVQNKVCVCAANEKSVPTTLGHRESEPTVITLTDLPQT